MAVAKGFFRIVGVYNGRSVHSVCQLWHYLLAHFALCSKLQWAPADSKGPIKKARAMSSTQSTGESALGAVHDGGGSQ